MTLLIVDDEFYSVENLKAKLDWAELGFDRVLCAYSMAQAQDHFRRGRIDVMLCDIEMPQGSGLELLEWVRGERRDTVCVFLTCYAQFDYAARAIHLGSSDYLLKPVDRDELRAAIDRAVEQVRRQEAQRTSELNAEYWSSSIVQRASQFWFRVVTGRVSAAPGELRGALRENQLPEALTELTYFPVLLHCMPTEESKTWETGLYEYGVKNVLRELFLPEGDAPENGVVLALDRNSYVVLLTGKVVPHDLFTRCELALSSFNASLPGIFRFFLDRECPIGGVADTVSRLTAAARENVTPRSLVLDAAQPQDPSDGALTVPAEAWGNLLLERRFEELAGEVRELLRKLSQRSQTSRRDLLHFYHDFSQIVYAQLERSGAVAHDMMVRPSLTELAERCCDSVADMERWVDGVLEAYRDRMDSLRMAGTVIEDIRRYIAEHLSEEITRGELAAAVYLSPDYLSHLFSEKTGMSLTAYITGERIRRAKELLLQNKLSVRDIALACGFQNISYFSKQFKRVVGMTPQDFRRGGGET